MRSTITLAALFAGCSVEAPQSHPDIVIEGAESIDDAALAEVTQAFVDSGAQYGLLVDPATGDIVSLMNPERAINSSDFSSVGAATCLDCGGVNATCTGPAGNQRVINVPLQRDVGSGSVDIAYAGSTNWSPIGQNCNGSACPTDVDASGGPVPFDVNLIGALNTCSAFSVFFNTDGPPPPPVQQNLQNATSFNLQPGWEVFKTIDGNFSFNTGWANGGVPNPNFAVYETVTDTPIYNGGTTVTVDLYTNYNNDHGVGCFRVSVTDADRSQFADGAQNNGDLGDPSIWSVVDITDASALNTVAPLTITGDNRVVAADEDLNSEVLTATGTTSIEGITGVKLEMCTDPSLPQGTGPGLAFNRNYVLTEFEFSTAAL